MSRDMTPSEIDAKYEPEIEELQQRVKELFKEYSRAKRKLKTLKDIVECWGEKANKVDAA